MGIVDYIYIRVYDAYKKKSDPARFSASLYVSLVVIQLFSPIVLFCAELFRTENETIDLIIFWGYFISIVVWTFCTFNKKRIQRLSKQLSRDRYKSAIPTWIMFTILPISFIWSVAMYWLLRHYIIHPYQFEGFFVK